MNEQSPASGTRRNWLRTIAAVFGGAVAALGAAAAVIDNSETVGRFVAERLYPFVQTRTAFVVALDAKAPRTLFIAVVDKENPNRPVDQQSVKPGGSATFEVPIKAFYALSWEGAGYKAAAIDQVLAPAETRRWTLNLAEESEDGTVLKPNEEGVSTDIETVPVPAATLIAGASASEQAGGTAPAGGAQLMPELSRALSTVGLFEVGTTDCMTRTYVSDYDLGVGCLAASIPGPLADIFKAIDARQPGLLDHFLGEDAAFIRRLAALDIGGQMAAYKELKGQKERQRRLRDGLKALAQTLDFRSEYQVLAESVYARALQQAKRLDLRSERGVLFVFNLDVQQGYGWFNKIAADYAQQAKGIASGDDRKRLELLNGLIKSAYPKLANFKNLTTRIDTIVSGQGTLRGIAFDLDSIGIRYDAPIVIDTAGVTIHPAESAVAPAGCGDISSTGGITACVRSLVVEHLGVDPTKVTDAAGFIDDLGADDLDLAELVMAFEEQFGCEISDEQAAKIVTVKDAVDVIAAAIGAPPG